MSKYNVSVDGVSVEAIFNILGGVEGAKAVLRGDLVLVPGEKVGDVTSVVTPKTEEVVNGGELTPPPGVRIHLLRIRYNPDGDWKEAIDKGGPNTPAVYDVRKREVSDQYPPTGTGEVEGDFVLLNFPKGGGSWDKALKWAKSQGLLLTTPREAFAIGENHPNLSTTLGQNPMYVVATTECLFEGDRLACSLWFGESDRAACLCWVGVFGDARGWFLFRKKQS